MHSENHVYTYQKANVYSSLQHLNFNKVNFSHFSKNAAKNQCL